MGFTNMATVIISGRVLLTEQRSGHKLQDDGTKRPWSISTAKVLVADTDVTEFSYDPSTDGALRKDDEIEALCSASTYRGDPSFRVIPGHLRVEGQALRSVPAEA